MRRLAPPALLVAALAPCLSCAALFPAPELPGEAERLVARTADGWDLSIIHYAPRAPLPGRRPVLLLHGIVTNERNLDYDERHSLARWLSRRGLDVYALSLRGTGESARPHLLSGAHKYDWDFDTLATLDLPAAIAFVRARTGQERIDFVGHSLGGMILYALLARDPSAPIGAAVTLGSPVGFRWGPRFTALAQSAGVLGGHLPMIALTCSTALALPLISASPAPSALVFYNPENMDPAVWTGFLSIGVEDESPALARQAARWIERDRFVSRDGAIDYEAGLRAVRTPVLVVAGKVDQLGFPPLVRRGYDALGGEKRFLLVAEENGASADYGHMDLLLGERAAEDVFVPIARWLDDRAGR